MVGSFSFVVFSVLSDSGGYPETRARLVDRSTGSTSSAAAPLHNVKTLIRMVDLDYFFLYNEIGSDQCPMGFSKESK